MELSCKTVKIFYDDRRLNLIKTVTGSSNICDSASVWIDVLIRQSDFFMKSSGGDFISILFFHEAFSLI